MKIFAVVRNYGEICDGSPFGKGALSWFEIPDSSLLRSGQPFFVPDFAEEFRVFPTVVYRVSRLGKGIAARFSKRYFDAVTLGCCAVAVDLLGNLRSHGEPWCRAVAFDKCCMLGNFVPLDDFPDRWVVKCGDIEALYNMNDIRHDVGEVLESLSRDITVKEGDMIMAAMHPVGLPLRIGTKLVARPENDTPGGNCGLDINIR